MKLHGLLAEYPDSTALKAAAKKIRDAGFTRWDCFSPYPVHGLDPAMGIKMTKLPLVVFAVGVIGCGLGFLLQWWTNAYDWPWIVSGKPTWSWPANVPIGFEMTVLLAAFATFFGMWIANKLPQVWHPLFSRDKFRKVTTDGFFIAIEAEDEKFDRAETEALLTDAGASSIEAVEIPDDPKARKLPKPVVAFILLSAAASLVPLAYIARARTAKSGQPHWHVIPDMDFQAKHKAQSAARLNPAGTVARGTLGTDDHYDHGTVDGAWAATLPPSLNVSSKLLADGQSNYDVYCAPCHGVSGHGDGMVARRAEKVPAGKWNPPTSLHTEYVVTLPHGQLLNTIGYGARTMRGYGDKLTTEERWGVVLYVRALQRSQAALAEDVPPQELSKIPGTNP